MPKLIAAKISEKPVFRRLLDAYISEFEQYIGPQSDYPYFDVYWSEPNKRWPYFIQDQGRVVGFVMVNIWPASGKETDFSMAEFYIIPTARRCNIGQRAALATFRNHRGLWEVSVVNANQPALKFWTHVLKADALKNMESSRDTEHTIFRFEI